MRNETTGSAVTKPGGLHGSDAARGAALVAFCCLLVMASFVAVAAGAQSMPFSLVRNALFSFDGSRDHLVITMLRLPRVLAGLLAGSALAVSGAIMQAVTGNPLASPDLLGINAGAAFTVVLASVLFGLGFGDAHIWYAFAGAAFAALTVFSISSLGGAPAPLKLILAGAVVTTFLMSLTTVILVFDRVTLDSVRLWTVGSLSGRTMAQVASVAPYMGFGLVIALLLGRHLTTLSLGTDVSRSLGQNPFLWRVLALVVVVLLAGGAVALAGPIAFVGLVVAHVVRMTVGIDYRWILPFSAVGGAMLLLMADALGRVLFANQNFPAGVIMAVIGAPFLVWLARYRVKG